MTIPPKLSLWYASVIKFTFVGEGECVGKIMQTKAYKISPPNIHSLAGMGAPAVGFSSHLLRRRSFLRSYFYLPQKGREKEKATSFQKRHFLFFPFPFFRTKREFET